MPAGIPARQRNLHTRASGFIDVLRELLLERNFSRIQASEAGGARPQSDLREMEEAKVASVGLRSFSATDKLKQ